MFCIQKFLNNYLSEINGLTEIRKQIFQNFPSLIFRTFEYQTFDLVVPHQILAPQKCCKLVRKSFEIIIGVKLMG
jgi:hypothetical protein